MSAARIDPPFRADHVGSLLRPPALREAFRAWSAGSITIERFREVQDQAVRDAVALQQDAGLRAITDGEFRRPSYWARFVERTEGLEVRPSIFTFRDDHGGETAFTAPHVAARVKRSQSIAGDEFVFLRRTTRLTPKVTLPSPPTMHFWRLGESIEKSAYASVEAFFSDLARVYREEIADLADRGAAYVQLDDVPLAMLCDPAVRDRVGAEGWDPDALVDTYIGAINQALMDRPRRLAVAVHLCRGNFRGKWLSEGGYDRIAERLFGGLAVDAFFLEYDTPRAGDFAPLRFVPADKMVVLGLVSSKTPELESGDGLRRRIDEAARVLPIERLALSPQCGFASTARGNPLTIEDEKAKLGLVVEVAEAIWGSG